jgi:hypothetical protein
MCRKKVSWFVGTLVLVGLAAMASPAQATIIAEWNFASGNFFADSAGSYTLQSRGTDAVTQGTGGPTGAYAGFDGANSLQTLSALDLTGYSAITLSWYQRLKTNAYKVCFESTGNYNIFPGAFIGISNTGTDQVAFSLLEASGCSTKVAPQPFHEASNTTWQHYDVVFDLTAATGSRVKVYVDGVLAAADPGDQTPAIPTTAFVLGGLFNLGARTDNAGNVSLGDTVDIAHFVIQSGVAVPSPEPGTMALLGIGLVSLLCYAWRKQK